MLELGLQRVDLGVDRLGLARKGLDLLAAYLDELGMALLFGVVQVLFAGSLRLDGLDLPTDAFNRLLGTRQYAGQAQAQQNF